MLPLARPVGRGPWRRDRERDETAVRRATAHYHPTCDGPDILYDEADYHRPLELEVGDRVLIHGADAYTTSYCSVGFNAFPPLASYYVAGQEKHHPSLLRDYEPALAGVAR